MSSMVMLQQCSLANTPHLSFYRVHVEVKFISAATVNLLKRTWDLARLLKRTVMLVCNCMYVHMILGLVFYTDSGTVNIRQFNLIAQST